MYRISSSVFEALKQNRQHINPVEIAKDYITFEGSLWGLEFILCKEQNEDNKNLIKEIFAPRQSIGQVGDDYFQTLVDSHNYKEIDTILSTLFPYLPPEKIIKLNNIFNALELVVLEQNYSSHELNTLGIYPCVWNDDQSPKHGFNKYHILNDYNNLKNIFQAASKEQDFILSFVG